MADTFMIGGELEVNRLGFGAMRVQAEEGIRVLRRVVELGTNLIDTADVYGAETSELLTAEALHPYPDGLVIATKGGITYDADAGRTRDGRAASLHRACERSLQRLRLETIDVYQLHRHDPEVELEESVGALADLRREGKIRHIGLSNVSVEQLQRARAVAPIATVQNEYSRWLTISGNLRLAPQLTPHGVGNLRPRSRQARPVREAVRPAAAGVERSFDVAERRGLVLMEAFMWRHHPQTRVLEELVRNGAIGELRRADAVGQARAIEALYRSAETGTAVRLKRQTAARVARHSAERAT